MPVLGCACTVSSRARLGFSDAREGAGEIWRFATELKDWKELNGCV